MFSFLQPAQPNAPQAQTRRIKVKAQVTTEIELSLDSIPYLGPEPESMQSPRREQKQEEKPKPWCGLC